MEINQSNSDNYLPHFNDLSHMLTILQQYIAANDQTSIQNSLKQIIEALDQIKQKYINLEIVNDELQQKHAETIRQFKELEKKYESMKIRLTDTYNQFARGTQMF